MRRLFGEIIILTCISSIIICYKFNLIPKNLCYDEVEFAKLALSLDNIRYIPYSTLATGHSTLYFYIILFSFKIFGITNFALRFPSALFGLANVIMLYLIMRKIYYKNNNLQIVLSNKVKKSNLESLIANSLPLVITIIFLTARWYFNFARFSFEVTFLLFLELTSIYFLIRYIKSKKLIDILFTGLFTGLAFNSYSPGRIFFILPLLILVSLWNSSLLRLRWISDLPIKQLTLGFLIFFLTLLPLCSYLLTKPDIRFEQQFFINNSNESLQRKIEFLWSNIKNTALMFNIKGDINGRHNYPGKPALNPVLGLFFIGGLIISLKNYKNFYNQFFLLYFIISLLPTLFTYPWENPNMLRTFTVIPSVIYLVGLSIKFFLRDLKLKGTYKQYLILIMLLMLFLSSAYEIRTYFKYQVRVFDTAFEVRKDLKNYLNHRARPSL
jgi:4-amino-4-deoxy-L-arabinose transferase-like glycosyltransferase